MLGTVWGSTYPGELGGIIAGHLTRSLGHCALWGLATPTREAPKRPSLHQKLSPTHPPNSACRLGSELTSYSSVVRRTINGTRLSSGLSASTKRASWSVIRTSLFLFGGGRLLSPPECFTGSMADLPQKSLGHWNSGAGCLKCAADQLLLFLPSHQGLRLSGSLGTPTALALR